MRITVTLPDDLAAPLLPPGQEPARAALEAIGLEAYRRRRITSYQLRCLLGIPSRYQSSVNLRLQIYVLFADGKYAQSREAAPQCSPGRQPRDPGRSPIQPPRGG